MLRFLMEHLLQGFGFNGAKAYKDSKLSLMILANTLHAKYHKLTGITFSSIYPGCIAESPLFREKRAWFRKYFPIFMKYITGGFVGEEEAGKRLMQVAHDPRCDKSGVYWSWNGGPREGRGTEALERDGQISGGGGAGGGWDSIFVNEQSGKALDLDLGMDLFRLSADITGADWPKIKPVTSPCPTLKVIGAISKSMIEKEELKRMQEQPGFNADGSPIKPKLTKVQKTKVVTDKIVGGITKRTLGRIGRFLGRRLLGRVPHTALEGSYQETIAGQSTVSAIDIKAQTSIDKDNEPKSPSVSENKDLKDELIVNVAVKEPTSLKIEDSEVFEKSTVLLERDIENAVFNNGKVVNEKMSV